MAKKRIERKTPSRGTQVGVKGLFAKVALVEKSTMINKIPDFKAGDTIKVHARIKEGEKERIQIFEGVVISKSNKGGSKSFMVRKMSHGVGVERIFLETSPKIARIEIVAEGKVRRAKLYYLRALAGRAAKIEKELDQSGTDAAIASAAKAGQKA